MSKRSEGLISDNYRRYPDWYLPGQIIVYIVKVFMDEKRIPSMSECYRKIGGAEYKRFKKNYTSDVVRIVISSLKFRLMVGNSQPRTA